MRRILYFAPLLAAMAIAGCETVQGAGRDMQTAGQMLSQQRFSAGAQAGQPMVSDPFAPQAGF